MSALPTKADMRLAVQKCPLSAISGLSILHHDGCTSGKRYEASLSTHGCMSAQLMAPHICGF